MVSFLIRFRQQSLIVNHLSNFFCEDTDVFALLCHCYHSNDWQVNLYMAEFSEGKSIISIKDSVKTHNQLIPDLLSVHALTGCDSVSMMYGIGMKKSSLADQLKSFSLASYILMFLYRAFKSILIPAQLYHDLQCTFIDALSSCAKGKELFTESPLYFVLDGTDPLERLFGNCFMQYKSKGMNCLEMSDLS